MSQDFPRPNLADISEVAWRRYVDACIGLRSKPSTRYPGLSVYEEFVRLHDEFGSAAHGGASFLVWHRVYLWEFEKQLDSVVPGARIPSYVRFSLSSVLDKFFLRRAHTNLFVAS